MAKISTSSSVVSWRKMTKTTHLGKKTSSSPQKKKPIPHQPRRTRWQEASSLADRRRMTMKTTTSRKPKTVAASAVTVAETMAATSTAAAATATSAWLHRSSAANLRCLLVVDCRSKPIDRL
jgi:hypothetical protein